MRNAETNEEDRKAAKQIALRVVKGKYARKAPEKTFTQRVEEDFRKMEENLYNPLS